jgi:hypothetical protein
MNTVDANTAAALDKRSGRADALMSIVVGTGPGRIISSVATGPDADRTFHPTGSSQIVRIPTLTAARAYTLGHTGATGGDRMLFYVEGTGPSPSGYVDIKNNVGTGLIRIGMTNHSTPNLLAEASSAEMIYVGSGWQLLRGGGGGGLRAIEFTSSTSWVAPPGIHTVGLEGWGGGGGGGGGAQIPTGITNRCMTIGGGGGGGAQLEVARINVKPLRTYNVIIGAGGTGSDANTAGSAGGDTIFTDSVTGEVLATFRGAGGGGTIGTYLDWGVSNPTQVHHFAKGGFSIRGAVATNICMLDVPSGPIIWSVAGSFGKNVPGAGGDAVSVLVPTMFAMSYGMASIRGHVGGGQGRWGTGIAGYADFLGAGGPGGGGGGGPGGPGVTGGWGGSYNGGVPSTVPSGVLHDPRSQGGTTPPEALANSGAGGGGGGGGGSGDLSLFPGLGARGGNGGSGKLILMLIK